MVRPPPRWTLWLASCAAVYPPVVLLQGLIGALVEGWPLLLRSALLPVVLLTLMTYAVMPVVTRLGTAVALSGALGAGQGPNAP